MYVMCVHSHRRGAVKNKEIYKKFTSSPRLRNICVPLVHPFQTTSFIPVEHWYFW